MKKAMFHVVREWGKFIPLVYAVAFAINAVLSLIVAPVSKLMDGEMVISDTVPVIIHSALFAGCVTLAAFLFVSFFVYIIGISDRD